MSIVCHCVVFRYGRLRISNQLALWKVCNMGTHNIISLLSKCLNYNAGILLDMCMGFRLPRDLKLTLPRKY